MHQHGRGLTFFFCEFIFIQMMGCFFVLQIVADKKCQLVFLFFGAHLEFENETPMGKKYSDRVMVIGISSNKERIFRPGYCFWIFALKRARKFIFGH